MLKPFSYIFMFYTLLLAGANESFAANIEAFSGIMHNIDGITTEMYIAPWWDYDGVKTLPCRDTKDPDCTCSLEIAEFTISQGLPKNKLEKINVMLKNYTKKTIYPFARTLCRSSTWQFENERIVHLEAYLAYYSPDYISVVFPGGYKFDKISYNAMTLTIHVPTETIVPLNDIFNAADRKRYTERLLRGGCDIPISDAQPYSMTHWHSTGRPFPWLTLYIEPDTFAPHEKTLNDKWKVCQQVDKELRQEVAPHKKKWGYKGLINEDAIIIPPEYISSPAFKSLYYNMTEEYP